MIKILIHGADGVMGGHVASCVRRDPEMELAAGFDRVEKAAGEGQDFPIYNDFSKIREDFDVIIDFSVAAAVDALLDYVEKSHKALVLCTTGLSEAQEARIKEVSGHAPILRSANMSIGVNVLLGLVEEAARKLYRKNFDIEIVEQHHRRKTDAPSGTALMLADAAQTGASEPLSYVYGRHERREQRPKAEIGISAVRGGTIAGVHDVIFAGEEEVITLSHTAYSRVIFAEGALSAARFLCGKPAGLYGMKEV